MPSPRTEPGRWSMGRFLRRLDVRLVLALASTALLALLISGAALNQILPGYFKEQASIRLDASANSTALLIQDAASRATERGLGEYLTDP